MLVLIEALVRSFQGLPRVRVNDAIGSMSAGLIMLMLSFVFLRGFEVLAYVWIYENFRLVALPWDSPWTWWLMFFGVDLGYYWFHRMGHGMTGQAS